MLLTFESTIRVLNLSIGMYKLFCQVICILYFYVNNLTNYYSTQCKKYQYMFYIYHPSETHIYYDVVSVADS